MAFLMAFTMMFSLGSYAATTTNGTVPTTAPVEATMDPEVQRMVNRLEELKAMDTKNMPRSEKRKYAKEVKHIQKKLNAVGGGVYISAGALILIIVLLIVFL